MTGAEKRFGSAEENALSTIRDRYDVRDKSNTCHLDALKNVDGQHHRALGGVLICGPLVTPVALSVVDSINSYFNTFGNYASPLV